MIFTGFSRDTNAALEPGTRPLLDTILSSWFVSDFRARFRSGQLICVPAGMSPFPSHGVTAVSDLLLIPGLLYHFAHSSYLCVFVVFRISNEKVIFQSYGGCGRF